MREKISSLHDDIMLPKEMSGVGEYSNYPDRFDPTEKSVITRLEQFGVDVPIVEQELGKKIDQLTWTEYTDIIAGALTARYDTVVGSVVDKYYFPGQFRNEQGEELMELLKMSERYKEMGARPGIRLVKSSQDIGQQTNLIMGLEAGAHLIKSMDDLKKIADADVKLFGLQYNQETPLAGREGLTELGKKAVKYLFDHQLVVDLAHSGPKTRNDVLALTEDMAAGKLLAYTHGCTAEDMDQVWAGKMSDRAISKRELEKIIKLGGIVGLGVTKPFFSSTRSLAKRIDAISQVDGGIEHVAIGSDFGGVPPDFMNEIKKPEDFKVLADILSEEFNMADGDITKIFRQNAKEWLKQSLSNK